MKVPTEVQELVDVQETLSRALPLPPEGLVVVWIVQLVPSQCSAKVFEPCLPTAMQEVDVGQETPSSSAEPEGGSAEVCRVGSTTILWSWSGGSRGFW